jgi:NADH dehydrogenase
MDTNTHRIVVVGGGAGGLELATRLGDRLGRRGQAHVTLVERARTHFWKPHLHEIAAGSIDLDRHAVSYMAQAHWHHFQWRLGTMTGIDRARRQVIVAPVSDEQGRVVTGEQRIGYDTLVIAVGSKTNDFGTPGVAEHAIALETPADAERFHRRLVDACLRANDRRAGALRVAIIGAGATGVELAAELRNATRVLVSYGLDGIDADRDIELHLIEAADRVVPALPPRLSAAAERLLVKLGVRLHLRARVSAVTSHGVSLLDGTQIPAELVVWAAGVKAPEFLRSLDGLEVTPLNQLLVRDTLQTTADEAIFAIGDCAACAWTAKGGHVPPRAQAAHQQASHLVRNLARRVRGQRVEAWSYRDFGSLVSLGRYSTVGNLMGTVVGKNLWIDGLFARAMYVSLYQLHQLALHGAFKVALDTLARWISRRNLPLVKLH